ncbi:AAA family ATPase [Xylanimonas protaetiae]|uniref:AAA family ATPase n=1 Tax=Xylanimonas protaetiae TaxID=2509457 RepID=UPI001F5C6E74|nr:AAA family ATPase [Xylanimonas protaetiae]
MTESSIFDLYCVRVSVDEGSVAVSATNVLGRGALGAREVVIPLDRIGQVRFKAATRLVNGVITIERDGPAVQLHFRRKQTGAAEALLRTVEAARTRVGSAPSVSEPVVVQVEYLAATSSYPVPAADLPAWVVDLAPQDDRRGYAFAWRPATRPRVGDVGIDDAGRAVVVVGFGRHGYDGPVRDVVELLPGNVIDVVAQASPPPTADDAVVSVSPAKRIELTEEFEAALGILASGGSMFLTGKAGTGKSTLIRHFMESTRRRVVVAAPTGIAALNVDGLTLHRLFSFGASTTLDDVETGDYRPRRFAREIRGMDTLIIDEASMVRADLLDQIEVALRRYGPHPGKPFGGVQVVLVGDLFQLPPVVPEREKAWLASRYETEYFFSARAFSRDRFPTVALTKVFRQLGDDRLTGLLNAVREGLLADEMRADLNTRADGAFEPPADEFWLTVAPTNSIVTSRNRAALERLPGEAFHRAATTWGDTSNFDSPVEDVVVFKVGAQIMLLNNDTADRWVNGTIGRVEKVDGDAVVVRLNGGDVVEVTAHTWEVTEPRFVDGAMSREVVGGYTQLPFKLAWAVTIHKCQGLTLDRLVVDLSGGTFAFGQAYVALSRCTSMQGLVLHRPVEARHLQTDRRVVRFLAAASGAQARGHVAVAALLVGADDVRSKPRPVEIALAFDDGTEFSTLVNPERDLTGAREAFDLGVDDITLAPNLAQAWSVLARLLDGAVAVGVDVDRTLGYVDWELKRLGVVRPFPPGVVVDPSHAKGDEAAELAAPSALRRARAALAIFRRDGGEGGAAFEPANAEDQASYVLTRDTVTVPDAGPALASLISASRTVSDAILHGVPAPPESAAGNEMIRQVVTARLTSVAQKSAGLSPTLVERLSLLMPMLGTDLGAELAWAGGADAASAVYRGARVCFTGDAIGPDGSPLSRAEMNEHAERIGLAPVNNVTKTRCDLLVVAELGTQSGKARKAAEYGKPVISVADFLAAVPGDPPVVPPPTRTRPPQPTAFDGATDPVPPTEPIVRAATMPARARRPRAVEAAEALALQRDGRTLDDIAAVLGKSPSTVSDLLSDARFYESPEGQPERLALARRAAELRATTSMGKAEIVALLDLGRKAADRVFRDAELVASRAEAGSD